MISLEDIKPCLQGVIPSVVMTCSLEGVPNVSFLSQVHFVDKTHVALTSQYFNSTRRNLEENPNCTVRVAHPETFISYRLLARHVRTETSGPLFDEMRVRLAAVADYSGAAEILRLKAVEILEVLDVSVFEGEAVDPVSDRSASPAPPRFSVNSLQNAVERANSACTLDEAFDSILKAMDLEFGFRNSMIFLPEDSFQYLSVIATRGYAQNGVGAEVKFGEGVIGRAALAKHPLMHTSLARDFIYSKSVVDQTKAQGLELHLREAIALPGLKASNSQVAVPMLIRDELIGVLFAESEKIFEFNEDDTQLLRTLGSVLAMVIHSLQLLHRMGEEPPPSHDPPLQESSTGERLLITYYERDECIFVNGEYLIRSLPARILWKLLNQTVNDGKVEFTNRELRMDRSLQLPEIKDNLESRLILLRKRLEKKCPGIAIRPAGRGRFTLVISPSIRLEIA